MKDISEGLTGAILTLIMVPTWLMGIVLAEGFWQTTCTFFPPYAWYLTVEWFMMGMPPVN